LPLYPFWVLQGFMPSLLELPMPLLHLRACALLGDKV
jgi:hypothetical protein